MPSVYLPASSSFERQPWEPKSSTGVRYVFDARDQSRMTFIGADVMSWTPKVNNILYADTVSATPPAYNTTGINSKPSVDFDGTGDYIPNETYLGVLPLAATRSVVVALADLDAIAGDGSNPNDTRRAIFAWGTDLGRRVFGYKNVSGTFRANLFCADQSLIEFANTAVDAVGVHILTYITDTSTAVRVRVDGGNEQGGTLGEAINTLDGRSRIGVNANSSPAWHMHGKVAMILVAGDVGDGVAHQMEGYCAWEYGLTSLLHSAHPYKTIRPFV